MSDTKRLKGSITEKQEFLFPDQPLAEMPEEICLAAAQNGTVGIQVLFACSDPQGSISLTGQGFRTEIYQMLDVPVEYNTGNGVEQEGAMVILPKECPEYSIRLAPFRVYDCLRPLSGPCAKARGGKGTQVEARGGKGAQVEARSGRAAVYLCLSPERGTAPGKHELCLRIEADGLEQICRIFVDVFPVAIKEERFRQTNWFSLDSMAYTHKVEQDTPEFLEILRQYARAMRRTHQRTFCIWLKPGEKSRLKPPYHFDFSHLEPLIRVFFDEGFDTLETGGILNRGYLADGREDWYTDSLKCAAALEIPVDSDEGYEFLQCLMRDFAAFLQRNGWQENVLFHVIDEPDVHYKTEEDLAARRRQYFLAANIVRKHLPGVRIIEAVQTTLFKGAIDIMVPLTKTYQRKKEIFHTIVSSGDEVWVYVCCAPQGVWLNRFLDQPLANLRLLFWGCSANHIPGFLHWGFNFFGENLDPFAGTSCPNSTGLGTNFPCGDAFLVYPGEDGPWLSLRLEAQRRGAEDAALLDALREKDPSAHDALVAEVFQKFDTYDNDPEKMELVYRRLLEALS